MSEFHSLANLIKRLEVATTRLEDLAMSASSASAVSASAPASSAPAAPPAATTSSSASSDIPLAVEKHDEVVNPSLDQFLKLSQEIGGLVADQASAVAEAFKAEREIIRISCLAQKPDMSSSTFMKLIEPIQGALATIIDIKNNNRGDTLFNHLSTVAEGVPALGWFTVEPTPVPFIRDMKDAAQFYSNRVVKEWKEKDTKHVEWTQAFLATLEALGRYVKENHPTGLTWNAKGQKVDAFIGQAAPSAPAPSASPAAPAPPAGGAPPPPPPPPPMAFDDEPAQPSGAAAVFAEINKGESVTAGLRKVDKSQMTHKNPELRAAGAADVSARKQAPPTPNKPNKYVLKKPAKTTLEANKWVVEYHENNSEIVIEETAINQAVYIFGCKNSTIRIKGKVNAVSVDSCVKCGIALDSTVSTVDLVNCKSFGLQVFNFTPTIAVDKCDGGEIYLSKECLDVEILSAKSTSLNVLIPEDVDDETSDFKEVPVPEQFKTTIVDGKLVTVTVEHAG
ncbi:adenylate cyclase associated N terminal-domain-containing protein [Radiomyces spectabilis]|uniref:adenylate cyclase associated N terminal-domain-containing protein n=1 Tax=Radiomyces spectabilis TaxID=64574 RepID=UPI00221EB6BE|nr:adenylate cyclase associated N terminal-domain-containing protein [Radiomyces spectabilis]KAI8370673.1 adenylate cyclase associated N terminal-domain-containing protein [Radiomyces spectabilis]